VLSSLASELTGRMEPSYGPEWLWTAWLGRDCIYLVRLPRAQPATPPPETSPPATPRVAEGDSDKAAHASPSDASFREEGIIDIKVILPRDEVSGEVLKAAIPSASTQPERIRREVHIDYYPHSLEEYSKALALSTNLTVTWYPDPSKDKESDKIYRAQFYYGPNSVAVTSSRGTPTKEEVWATQGSLMRKFIADATENGMGYEEPDRQVWVALLTDKGFIFLMLPNPFWH
jgi:hypothetical protein